MHLNIGDNKVPEYVFGKVPYHTGALWDMRAFQDWIDRAQFAREEAADDELFTQLLIDSGYSIDAPDYVPIGGAVISGAPGAKGRYRADSWHYHHGDQVVWMSGFALFTQCRRYD